MCSRIAPQPSQCAVWGKEQAAGAWVRVLLGVASGRAGSEVRLPETCSVQGVPGGRMRWVNMARGLPTP